MSYNITTAFDQNKDCPICLEALNNTQEVAAHSQGGEHHPIHLICLRTFAQSRLYNQIQIQCPICRINISHIPGMNLAPQIPNVLRVHQFAIGNILPSPPIIQRMGFAYLQFDENDDEEIRLEAANDLNRFAAEGNLTSVQETLFLHPNLRLEDRQNAIQIATNHGHHLIAQEISSSM